MNNTLTTYDIANILGLHVTHVRLLARRMGLGTKGGYHNMTWEFTEEEAEQIAARPNTWSDKERTARKVRNG